jgi:hypothetical protein
MKNNKHCSKLFIGVMMPCYAHRTILAKILGVVKRIPFKFMGKNLLIPADLGVGCNGYW